MSDLKALAPADPKVDDNIVYKDPVYYLDLEQNTDEWNEARGGIPTASGFDRVLSPATLKPSASRNEYIGEILSYGVEDKDGNRFYGEHMEEGHAREDESIADYEIMTGLKTHKCGIIYRDHTLTSACSPDALVGSDGGVEVKNPMLKTHIKYVIDNVIPSKYRPQVYTSLAISGRDWWDFVSYHPSAKPFILRATKNDVMTIGTGKNKVERKILDVINEQIDLLLADIEQARKKVFHQ